MNIRLRVFSKKHPYGQVFVEYLLAVTLLGSTFLILESSSLGLSTSLINSFLSYRFSLSLP